MIELINKNNLEKFIENSSKKSNKVNRKINGKWVAGTYIPTMSTFEELDTGNLYVFNANGGDTYIYKDPYLKTKKTYYLGEWVKVDSVPKNIQYSCVSSDLSTFNNKNRSKNKTNYISNGSKCFVFDVKKIYVFDELTDKWIENKINEGTGSSVKVDGSSIKQNDDGTISVPTASTTQAGTVKVDGKSITIDKGVISAKVTVDDTKVNTAVNNYLTTNGVSASSVKLTDKTSVEDNISQLKEDLVCLNEIDVSKLIGMLENTAIYAGGTKKLQSTGGQGYNYKVYNVEGLNKIYVSLKTVDRTSKTELPYVILTDDISFPVVNDAVNIVNSFLSPKEEKEYKDEEIEISNNAKYVYVMYNNTADMNIKIKTSLKDKVNNLNATNINMKNGESIEDTINSMSDKKVIEIPVVLEQGSFDGDGKGVNSTNTVRIKNGLQCDIGTRYRIELNKVCDIVYNKSNVNSLFTSAMFEFVAWDNFCSFGFKNTDGTDITTEDLDIKVYKVINRKHDLYDIVVASNDATDYEKSQADLVCDGINDEREIQCAVNSNIFNSNNCNVLLLGKNFYIDEFTNINTSNITSNCGINAITLQKSTIGNKSYSVRIDGKYHGHFSKNSSTKILVNCVEKLDDTTSYSIFGAIRNTATDKNPDGAMFDIFDLNINNLFISTNTFRKKIICIDGCGCSQLGIDNVGISWNSDYTVSDISGITYEDETNTPVEGLIGIRGVYGSNRGKKNYIKHSLLCGMYEGIALTGEHFIIEDCLEHHCYYGFTIGNHNCRKQMEHPNIFIGNSVEQCYRMALLNRFGATVEADYDYNTHGFQQTFIYIGGSTEGSYKNSNNESVAMLPIKEIVRGAYRGRYESDGVGFEENSGKHIDIKVY
ncbi:MAG: hypothetical protein PUE01_02035 [Clostridiaceae bacterium]|nr:hypothetical protein [Clostridiaceae bacterium]